MIKEKILPMQDLKLFGIYKDGKFYHTGKHRSGHCRKAG